MAERVFPALKSDPPVVEALLIPFHHQHKPTGTVWVVAHDEQRKFDREDDRIIITLARFASVSWQLWKARVGAEAAARNRHQQALNLAAANHVLKAHIDKRTEVEEQLQELNREFRTRIGQGTVALTQANAGLVSGNFPNPVANAEMRADIGELAASIAHDFNNILNIVQAYAALIVSNPAKPQDVIEHAEVIRETVEKGVVLARQLLSVGGKTETKLELADINELLQRTTKSLSPTFPRTIVIAADLDACVPMIIIDAGLIYQAILNLCINARDAMPEGGKILLQTRVVPGVVLRQRFPQAEAEHYVCIGVADTGVGMEAEVRRRVFEAYFTTKKSGRGSGLGLSIVHRIVAEHAGFIEATSEPGCGSTFHIYLPVPGGTPAADAITPMSQHTAG